MLADESVQLLAQPVHLGAKLGGVFTAKIYGVGSKRRDIGMSDLGPNGPRTLAQVRFQDAPPMALLTSIAVVRPQNRHASLIRSSTHQPASKQANLHAIIPCQDAPDFATARNN